MKVYEITADGLVHPYITVQRSRDNQTYILFGNSKLLLNPSEVDIIPPECGKNGEWLPPRITEVAALQRGEKFRLRRPLWWERYINLYALVVWRLPASASIGGCSALFVVWPGEDYLDCLAVLRRGQYLEAVTREQKGETKYRVTYTRYDLFVDLITWPLEEKI